MSNPYREDILIVKLREGLYEAIQQASEVTVADLDSITFQKLLLKAIERFDLRGDITVQWYLDGEIIGSDQAKIDRLGKKGRLSRANEFHLSQTPSVSTVADFYLSMNEPSFDEFINGPTFEYLREYYQENERIPYRELYLKNLDIDGNLSKIRDNLKNSENPEESEEKIINSCQEFKLELLMYEEFSNIIPYLRVFEQSATSIIQWVINTSEVSSEKRASLVTHCDEFYYEGLWRGIACIISSNNVEGPSENQVRKRRLGELSAHKETFQQRYEALKKEAEDAGLELSSLSKQLPELTQEATDHEWLEETIIEASFDKENIPIEEAAQTDDDEIFSEKDSGQPLSEMVVEERRN